MAKLIRWQFGNSAGTSGSRASKPSKSSRQSQMKTAKTRRNAYGPRHAAPREGGVSERRSPTSVGEDVLPRRHGCDPGDGPPRARGNGGLSDAEPLRER